MCATFTVAWSNSLGKMQSSQFYMRDTLGKTCPHTYFASYLSLVNSEYGNLTRWPMYSYLIFTWVRSASSHYWQWAKFGQFFFLNVTRSSPFKCFINRAAVLKVKREYWYMNKKKVSRYFKRLSCFLQHHILPLQSLQLLFVTHVNVSCYIITTEQIFRSSTCKVLVI